MMITIFMLFLLYFAMSMTYWNEGEHLSFKSYAAFCITAFLIYNLFRYFV
jgi:hypothetical protein